MYDAIVLRVRQKGFGEAAGGGTAPLLFTNKCRLK